jgi:4-hydroxybenzoate polyprenyltransferase
MKSMLLDLAISARPRQWSKNLVCFAALVFADRLTVSECVLRAALGFLSFCLASSAVYVYNDIRDRDQDQVHPVKRHRPIAAGRLGIRAALVEAVVLVSASAALAAILQPRFGVVLASYLILSFLYSGGLKHLVILDVVTIALGFVLRVQAGIEAIAAPQSAWVLLCMFFMALFLGFGKRHGEITALNGTDGKHQRPVLQSYSISYLNILLGLSATTALVCYSLYTVTVQANQTFLLTILPVTFGIGRYLLLIVIRTEGEDPEEMLTRDMPLVLTVLIWALLCVAILYFDLQIFPHSQIS